MGGVGNGFISQKQPSVLPLSPDYRVDSQQNCDTCDSACSIETTHHFTSWDSRLSPGQVGCSRWTPITAPLSVIWYPEWVIDALGSICRINDLFLALGNMGNMCIVYSKNCSNMHAMQAPVLFCLSVEGIKLVFAFLMLFCCFFYFLFENHLWKDMCRPPWMLGC